jgi:superoxide dismutase
MSDEKMYTESEMRHLAAREVAQQRMSDIERNINQSEDRTLNAIAEIKTQIATLTNLVREQSSNMEKSQDNLREEIKKDFATKAELQSDFETLNTKIDTQWSKLVLIVSTVTTIGALFGILAQFVLKFLHVG